MQAISVNSVIPEYKGAPEGASASLTSSGLHIVLTWSNASKKEIKSINDLIVLKYVCVDNLPMLICKFDGESYADMPIVVEDEEINTVVEDGMGMLVTIVLADPLTGVVKAMRALSLTTEMTRAIFKDCKQCGALSPYEYLIRARLVQDKYSVNQLINKEEHTTVVKGGK